MFGQSAPLFVRTSPMNLADGGYSPKLIADALRTLKPTLTASSDLATSFHPRLTAFPLPYSEINISGRVVYPPPHELFLQFSLVNMVNLAAGNFPYKCNFQRCAP